MKELNQWLNAREKEIKAGRKKHKKSMFHRLAYDDLAACLQDVRAAVGAGDIEAAVMATARFVKKYHGYSIQLSVPEIRSTVGTAGGKKAAKAKQENTGLKISGSNWRWNTWPSAPISKVIGRPIVT